MAERPQLQSLVLTDNARLAQLPVLPGPTEMTFINVSRHPALTRGPRLPNLRVLRNESPESQYHLTAALDLRGSDGLLDLGDFTRLEEVVGGLRLVVNPALAQVALPRLQAVDWLELTDNRLLTAVALPVLPRLDHRTQPRPC